MKSKHIQKTKSLEIENEDLSVSYDRVENTVSLTEKRTGLIFVKDCRIEGGDGNAVTSSARDPIFGIGHKIVIHQSDGNSVSLEVYRKLQFVLVRKTIKNSGASELDLQKSVPLTFELDLGESATVLRTLGTGGLLPAEQNPGSYVLLACAVPETRRGVVTGWITQDRGSGVVFSSVKNDKVGFSAQIDYGHLRIPAGESVTLETFAIGFFDDARIGLENFADTIKRQYGIKLRPRSAVYCTWYSEEHGGAGDEKSTVELARFIDGSLKSYGLTVLQIDDWWQDGPKLDGPARGFDQVRPDGPYPHGIAPVARELEKLGLTLGLWWLPFGRNHADPAWKDRQEWFARWADGTPMKTKSFGGTCLDLTHPEVKQHLAMLAKRYREWGVKYYKMDGLWTGTATELAYINDGYKDDNMSNVSPFHDPSKTQIEAYRDGLKLLRQNAGDDVFFSGCAVSQNMRSFGGSFGLVDAMRIGPDFNHDKLGVKTGPIRASRLYFLNGRVWWNDPDPTKVRASDSVSAADKGANGAVSLGMAQLTTSFSALTGQFFLLSDWLPNLPKERIEILKRTMESHDAVARPVDYFDNFLPYIWLLTDEKSGVRRNVFGLFNWEHKAQTLGTTLLKAGLDPACTYHAFDFWNNTLLPDVKNSLSYELPPESCRIIAVRAAENQPLLLSTSRHVTQGIVDVISERWNGNTLSGISSVIAGDPYELRIRVPEGWIFEKALADITVTVIESDGIVRLTLTSSISRNVKWKAKFRINR